MKLTALEQFLIDAGNAFLGELLEKIEDPVDLGRSQAALGLFSDLKSGKVGKPAV